MVTELPCFLVTVRQCCSRCLDLFSCLSWTSWCVFMFNPKSKSSCKMKIIIMKNTFLESRLQKKKYFIQICIALTDWVSEVPLWNGSLRQVEQGFSSIFANFLAYLMMTLKYYQICQKPIFRLIPGTTRKSAVWLFCILAYCKMISDGAGTHN